MVPWTLLLWQLQRFLAMDAEPSPCEIYRWAHYYIRLKQVLILLHSGRAHPLYYPEGSYAVHAHISAPFAFGQCRMEKIWIRRRLGGFDFMYAVGGSSRTLVKVVRLYLCVFRFLSDLYKLTPVRRNCSGLTIGVWHTDVLESNRTGRVEGYCRGRSVSSFLCICYLTDSLDFADKIGKDDAERDFYDKVIPTVQVYDLRLLL